MIANPETGILNIRATSRQHEKVQEFLDQVMTNARRQVLIEATVAEVQLNNQYQRGIDWQRLRSDATTTGVPSFSQGSERPRVRPDARPARPAGITTNAFVFGGAITSLNFNFALKLLESFGDVRVLSSPKISVLNNQTAVLKVVDNLVYFTIQAQSTANQTSTLTTFTTTLNSVPVGFIMSLVPQISDTDTVVLNLRPTISRKIGDVADPNPSLAAAGVVSLVPVIQTREMESVLRVQSGQVAVLGGLMQDAVTNIEDTIPGRARPPGHRPDLLAAQGWQPEDRTGDLPAPDRDQGREHRRRLRRLPPASSRSGFLQQAQSEQAAQRRHGRLSHEPAARGAQEGGKGQGGGAAPRARRA